MDLHGLLHRAYSRISELNTKVTDEEAKLWYVPKTAPLQNANSSVCEEDDNIGHRPFERMTQETRMAPMVYAAPPLSSSFYDDPVGRVTLADKALLLSLGGDGSLNADVEEAERGQRWRGEYAPFEMPGESLLSGGPAHNEQKPVCWLHHLGGSLTVHLLQCSHIIYHGWNFQWDMDDIIPSLLTAQVSRTKTNTRLIIIIIRSYRNQWDCKRSMRSILITGYGGGEGGGHPISGTGGPDANAMP